MAKKSKKANKLLAAAEERRQKRIAARKAQAKTKVEAKGGLSEGTSGIGHELDENAKDKAQRSDEEFGYSIPNEVADVVEQANKEAEESKKEGGAGGPIIPPALADKVSAFVDLEELSAAAPEDIQYEMVQFGASTGSAAEIIHEGAHWVLFANGAPAAEINVRDQLESEKIAGYFVTDDYARGVIDSIAMNGLSATLQASNAKPYAAVIDRDEELRKERNTLQASFNETLRASVSNTKASLMANAGLVVQASVNNFIVENPLKDASIRSMVTLGASIEEATRMVDKDWVEHGQATFSAMLDQAEEWSNTPAEAMAHIQKAINDAGQRSRPVSELVANNPNFNSQLAASMANAAVPVTPMRGDSNTVDATFGHGNAQTQDQSDSKEAYRNRFGGFRRH